VAREPFNLIVTHYPGYDNYSVARHQLTEALERYEIVDTSQSIMLLLVDNPYRAVEVLKERIPRDTPILRIIPVDAVVDVYVERIGPVARDVLYRKSSSSTETFMLRVDGRLYRRSDGDVVRLHTSEAIEYIASFIDRPVNLKNPNWIIYVKVVKLYRTTELASITVARPDQIVSFARGR